MGAIRSLRWSPDGRFLAASEPADFVHVYDASRGFRHAQEVRVAPVSSSLCAQASNGNRSSPLRAFSCHFMWPIQSRCLRETFPTPLHVWVCMGICCFISALPPTPTLGLSFLQIDLFGEISGMSFTPAGDALFVGIADITYASLLTFRRARPGGQFVAHPRQLYYHPQPPFPSGPLALLTEEDPGARGGGGYRRHGGDGDVRGAAGAGVAAQHHPQHNVHHQHLPPQQAFEADVDDEVEEGEEGGEQPIIL